MNRCICNTVKHAFRCRQYIALTDISPRVMENALQHVILAHFGHMMSYSASNESENRRNRMITYHIVVLQCLNSFLAMLRSFDAYRTIASSGNLKELLKTGPQSGKITCSLLFPWFSILRSRFPGRCNTKHTQKPPYGVRWHLMTIFSDFWRFCIFPLFFGGEGGIHIFRYSRQWGSKSTIITCSLLSLQLFLPWWHFRDAMPHNLPFRCLVNVSISVKFISFTEFFL